VARDSLWRPALCRVKTCTTIANFGVPLSLCFQCLGKGLFILFFFAFHNQASLFLGSAPLTITLDTPYMVSHFWFLILFLKFEMKVRPGIVTQALGCVSRIKRYLFTCLCTNTMMRAAGPDGCNAINMELIFAEWQDWRTSCWIWDPHSLQFRPKKSRFSQGNLAFAALN
jgi:hypothetical protein